MCIYIYIILGIIRLPGTLGIIIVHERDIPVEQPVLSFNHPLCGSTGMERPQSDNDQCFCVTGFQEIPSQWFLRLLYVTHLFQ